MHPAIADIAKERFAGFWVDPDLLIGRIINDAILVAYQDNGARLGLPAGINVGHVLDAIKQAGTAGREGIATFIVIIKEVVDVTGFEAEQRGELGAKGDGAVITNVIARNPWECGKGILRPQHI